MYSFAWYVLGSPEVILGYLVVCIGLGLSLDSKKSGELGAGVLILLIGLVMVWCGLGILTGHWSGGRT